MSFWELADSTINSFRESSKAFKPNDEFKFSSPDESNTLGKLAGSVEDVFLNRLALQERPAGYSPTSKEINTIPFFWAAQCEMAKSFYSLGHTNHAWAMLVEAAQVAGAWRVAVEASVGLERDGYKTIGEFKSLFARTGGTKRAEKIRMVELFSIQLFNERSWKSTKQAKTAMWPEVREKAKQHGWNMSDETGPETLYKWLLAHRKIQRLQVVP